ncbi:hypothetical protein FQN49_002684 [Arthroderma sp. PD_2]|nr:hypothetical protein FQN49_002684 [Arthroderma sp. PD_2]
MASMYFQHHSSPKVWDYLEQMDTEWTHESSLPSHDTAKAGELTWGAQLSYFPKQNPASARPRSLKREPSAASRGYRSEFLTSRDSIGRGRSVSGSSFSSLSTSSGQSCSPTRHDGPTGLSSVIQNLSSQLGFDLNETFNCATKCSKPVKSATSPAASTPVATSPKARTANASNSRREFVVKMPQQKPATTVEYDTLMSAMNTPVAVVGGKEPKSADEDTRSKEGDVRRLKKTRKVSFAEAVQELCLATEMDAEPEMILDDSGSDIESDSDSVPEAVFLNVETESKEAPRARHVEIRDAEEEERDYITVYHC